MSGETRKMDKNDHSKEGSTSENSKASGSKNSAIKNSEGEKITKNEKEPEEKNNVIEKSENIACDSDVTEKQNVVNAATKRPHKEDGESTISSSIQDQNNTAKRIKKNEDQSNDNEVRVNVTNAAVHFGERAQPGSSTAGAQPGYSGARAQPGFSGARAQPGFSGARAQPGYSGARAQPGYSGARAQPDCSGASSQPGSSGARAKPSLSGAGAQPGCSRHSAQSSCSGARAQPGSSGAQPGLNVQQPDSSSSLVDNTVEQVGDFVSMIMNHLPDESSIISGPSDQNNIESLPDLDLFPWCPASSSANDSQSNQSSIEGQGGAGQPVSAGQLATGQTGSSGQPVSTIHTFLTEARSLFSYYQCCLRLIEASSRDDFQHWSWLDSCLAKMAHHPRVSDKMKLRYYLHNKNNARTFQVIQKNLKLDLDNQFYMGKMNLLHIACDSGWPDLVHELVINQRMDVNLTCPSRHMKPGNLTPLMLASGAGHSEVVKVLLERDDINIDQKDSEGFTALFHSCNHGSNRVGDKHGYFRRLWSWDLSGEQILSMERIARQNSREIIRLLIIHGSDLVAKDNTGATVLFRASTVENFKDTIEFLVEVGCRVTHNVLNWTRVKNPDCVDMIESELCTPKTLSRLARLSVWKCLRQANKVQNFEKMLQVVNSGSNGDEAELYIPNILMDYLNCR